MSAAITAKTTAAAKASTVKTKPRQVYDPARAGRRRLRLWLCLAAVAVALALAVLWRIAGGSGEGPRGTWFYDLNTGQLFSMPYGTVPPVAAPSGDLHGAPPGTPAGVAAMVLRPLDGGEPLVAWLESRAATGAADSPPLLRLVDGTAWTTDGTPQARALMEQAAKRSAGKAVQQDFPP